MARSRRHQLSESAKSKDLGTFANSDPLCGGMASLARLLACGAYTKVPAYLPTIEACIKGRSACIFWSVNRRDGGTKTHSMPADRASSGIVRVVRPEAESYVLAGMRRRLSPISSRHSLSCCERLIGASLWPISDY